jgi:hypothetical protein
LATREVNGGKVILPVWHGVGFSEVRNYSPTLADRIAVQTKDGLAHVVEKIVEVIHDGDSNALAAGKTNAEPQHSFDEERIRHVRQVVGKTMTLNGQHLLRWLLLHNRIECARQFMPEISIETQNRQMEIAVQAGIVQRVEERISTLRTYYIVNPDIKPALEKVLAEILAEAR